MVVNNFPMELVCATQNPGKLRELRELLAPLAITILTPAMVGLAEFDVEETGSTFQENAELKAIAFAQESGKHALADDSGLEVAALNGQPGVHSKRIAASDAERIAWVLQRLADQDNRLARFVTVMCLADPDGRAVSFEGEVEGTIAEQPAGDSGFGYDPIFIPRGHTQTFAQMGQTEKNQISHRARALAKVRDFLEA